ncbi:MAG: 8-amino-7-oxononanoate synthase [Candidatus Omnitrophica bacterium]|nr:8-amino-7-oxononanoate synthase [Candidatus Omnitrophota bacterium]
MSSNLLLLTEDLEELKSKGLFRTLRTLSNIRGTHATWKDKEIILFCGNDYLGLSRHPRVIAKAREALQKYGVGSGAARLISGTSDLHTRLEEELARFKKKETALLYGAGYLTNVGVLSALAGQKDLIVMDKLCHASLIDGAKLSGATLRVFPHKNYEKCEEILKKGAGFRKRLLVSDTVFSMDGDLADLAELGRLKEKHKTQLIVDDAHGTGVFGPEGRGVTEGDVIVGTLSKAFGVYGGFAAASQSIIETLINFSRSFLFATASPPAFAGAALESLRLIQEDSSLREKLWQNVDKVKAFFRKKGIVSESESPIFPIIVGDENEAVRVSNELLRQGILIPAIRYPTVSKGKARLRLTVSAAHTEEDLEKLFKTLKGVLG